MKTKLFFHLLILIFTGHLWSQCPTGNVEIRTQINLFVICPTSVPI